MSSRFRRVDTAPARTPGSRLQHVLKAGAEVSEPPFDYRHPVVTINGVKVSTDPKAWSPWNNYQGLALGTYEEPGVPRVAQKVLGGMSEAQVSESTPRLSIHNKYWRLWIKDTSAPTGGAFSGFVLCRPLWDKTPYFFDSTITVNGVKVSTDPNAWSRWNKDQITALGLYEENTHYTAHTPGYGVPYAKVSDGTPYCSRHNIFYRYWIKSTDGSSGLILARPLDDNNPYV